MELAGIDGAEAKWDKAVEIAVLAEELGFDSLWVYDHFHNVPRPAHEAVFECWTTIAAISQRTTKIRLGQMVGCNSYREPSRAGQDHEHRRRDQRRPPRLGHRRRLVRERVQGLRLRVPGARRTASGCSRSASRSCGRCGPRRRPPTTASTTSSTARNCDPKPLQSPHPRDPHRRRRRAAHAARRGASGGPVELRRQARGVGAQVRDPEGPLHRRRARLRRDREDDLGRGA